MTQKPHASGFRIAAIIVAAFLALVCDRAHAQTTGDTAPTSSQDSSGSLITTNGILDKTYLSVGLENLSSGGSTLVVASTRIQREFEEALKSPDPKDTDFFRRLASDVQRKVFQNFLLELNLLMSRQLHSQGPSGGIPALATAAKQGDLVLEQYIAQVISGRNTSLDEVLDGETSPRRRRIRLEYHSHTDPQSDAKSIRPFITIRTDIANLLVAGTTDELKDFSLDPHADEAVADFMRYFPPRTMVAMSYGILSGDMRPTHVVDASHSDVMRGEDIVVGGVVGRFSGGTASYLRDLTPARSETVEYLSRLYGLKELIKSDLPEAKRRIAEYLDKLAYQYLRLHTSVHIGASFDLQYVGSRDESSGRYSQSTALSPGLAISILRPANPSHDAQGNEHAPGIGGLVSVQSISVFAVNGRSVTDSRTLLGVWIQDKVPYYRQEPVPDAPGVTRYAFDHWKVKLGAQVSNKLCDERAEPWALFLRFRFFPKHDGYVPTHELMSRDILFTVSFGKDGQSNRLLNCRLEKVF